MKYKVKSNFICNGLSKKVDELLTQEELDRIASNVQALFDKACLEVIFDGVDVTEAHTIGSGITEKSDQPMTPEEFEETQKKKHKKNK